MTFGRPILPISDEERTWVDGGFERLSRMLGHHRLLQAEIVLPTAEHFPDPYDRSAHSAEKMFCRICNYMKVASLRRSF